MLWRGQQGSNNIEDRRGIGPGSLAIGGGGCGTLLIIILGLIFGVDPSALLNNSPTTQQQPQTQQQQTRNDEQKQFISVVLKSTEDVWGSIFQQGGRRYQKPNMVLFNNRVQSACGIAGSATGPFYCPGDGKVYLDTSFFDELSRRFGAPGDFAQAYVVAHEIGHHVQNLLGVTDKVDNMQRRASEAQSNQLSVRLELQADCYAGVWGFYAKQQGLLEQGDFEEAIRAANAIGDDRLQSRSQGYVVPESFTHGSSKQRMEWFTKGFSSGDIRQCDTFSAR